MHSNNCPIKLLGLRLRPEIAVSPEREVRLFGPEKQQVSLKPILIGSRTSLLLEFSLLEQVVVAARSHDEYSRVT